MPSSTEKKQASILIAFAILIAGVFAVVSANAYADSAKATVCAADQAGEEIHKFPQEQSIDCLYEPVQQCLREEHSNFWNGAHGRGLYSFVYFEKVSKSKSWINHHGHLSKDTSLWSCAPNEYFVFTLKRILC